MISLSNVDLLDNITEDTFMQKYKKHEMPVVMKNLTKEWTDRNDELALIHINKHVEGL